MTYYLRRLPAYFAAGLRMLSDLLLWGDVYPRTDPALVARLATAVSQRRDGQDAVGQANVLPTVPTYPSSGATP
jgi:hypothetical protein